MGQPGAGKTTSMKFLCSRLLNDEKFYPGRFNFPIVIRLRDLNAEKITKQTERNDFLNSIQSLIFRKLYNLLGIDILIEKESFEDDKEVRQEALKRIIFDLLEHCKILMILDGFDEIVRPKFRDVAIKEIRELALYMSNCSLVLTSRSGEFNYHIENTSVFELCPLRKNQIITFSHKWLVNKKEAKIFISQINKSPFADTTIRPLTLAHLCAIYERIGKIPDKPKTVYRKVVNLLLEEWDEQRSIKRLSKYGQFEVDRKFEFLCNLAYNLTVKLNRTTFSDEDLNMVYKQICINFDLPEKEAKRVINEIETHTGLFIQIGYEHYEFSHKSIQEYLTAEYIVKLPRIPDDFEKIKKLSNELAIAVSISSNSSVYFSELIFNHFLEHNLNRVFYSSFISRLLQEKPDFHSHPEVILSLVTLHSLYLIGTSLKKAYQLKLFFDDPLQSQFENLILMLTKRNRTNIVLQHYSIQGEKESMDGEDLYELKKVKDLKNYKLPEFLYTRKTFLNA
jgi:predicted NACHT family NTPase